MQLTMLAAGELSKSNSLSRGCRACGAAQQQPGLAVVLNKAVIMGWLLLGVLL